MREANVSEKLEEDKPVAEGGEESVMKKETMDGLDSVLVKCANLPMDVVLLFNSRVWILLSRLCSMFLSSWEMAGGGSFLISWVIEGISLHAATAATGRSFAKLANIA